MIHLYVFVAMETLNFSCQDSPPTDGIATSPSEAQLVQSFLEWLDSTLHFNDNPPEFFTWRSLLISPFLIGDTSEIFVAVFPLSYNCIVVFGGENGYDFIFRSSECAMTHRWSPFRQGQGTEGVASPSEDASSKVPVLPVVPECFES